MLLLLILRGATVNRTYGTDKNLPGTVYTYLFLLLITIFGTIHYLVPGMVYRNIIFRPVIKGGWVEMYVEIVRPKLAKIPSLSGVVREFHLSAVPGMCVLCSSTQQHAGGRPPAGSKDTPQKNNTKRSTQEKKKKAGDVSRREKK